RRLDAWRRAHGLPCNGWDDASEFPEHEPPDVPTEPKPTALHATDYRSAAAQHAGMGRTSWTAARLARVWRCTI
ncbi:hypothetical protein LTS18_002561, partial [Coniosporium uncinatum]